MDKSQGGNSGSTKSFLFFSSFFFSSLYFCPRNGSMAGITVKTERNKPPSEVQSERENRNHRGRVLSFLRLLNSLRSTGRFSDVT